MTASRDVVLVTFHFPPQGGAGSLRLLSFARHLPEWGWRTRVVTVGDFGGRLSDHTLSSRIPSETEVERWFTPLVEWAYRHSPGSVAREAARRALLPIISYPDPAIGWSLATGWRLANRFREDPPAVFLTSAPPHSTHVVGLVASVITSVPWIVDLRDPWMRHDPAAISPLRHRAGSLLERTAVAHARCVLANTPRVAAVLRSMSRPPRRVEVLPNGYDEDEIRAARSQSRSPGKDSFTIVHAGALYKGHRDPLYFLDALAAARDAQRGARRVRFVIAGDSAFHRKPVLSETIRRLGLEAEVESPGYLPHDQVLAAMASADLLLLIQGPDFHLQVPSKAYEYLALGRPVLALTSGGATADLVRSSPLGTVLAPGDREGLVRYLVAAMARTTDPGPSDPPPTVSSRRELVARLAAVLDEVGRA